VHIVVQALAEVPLFMPSSHCSLLVVTPSPQRGPSWQVAVQWP
jgi:hypothetical protein